MNLIYILQHRQPVFTQSHIPLFRKQLFVAIVHNTIPVLHAPLSSNDIPFSIPASCLLPLLTLPFFSFISFLRPHDISPPRSNSQHSLHTRAIPPFSPHGTTPLFPHTPPSRPIRDYKDLYPS
jgi:hypothetical protein